jgi:hypothetical protein
MSRLLRSLLLPLLVYSVALLQEPCGATLVSNSSTNDTDLHSEWANIPSGISVPSYAHSMIFLADTICAVAGSDADDMGHVTSPLIASPSILVIKTNHVDIRIMSDVSSAVHGRDALQPYPERRYLANMYAFHRCRSINMPRNVSSSVAMRCLSW